ncbi:MAG: DUF1549 domain-containing protein, partial [Planctomycetes bacterium]|nr:DUF1549 domain-containing protein [Planctomycetota bacterium]
MNRIYSSAVWSITVAVFFVAGQFGDCTRLCAQTTNEFVDFGRQVQPILARRCFACHGPDKAEAGLRFDQKSSPFSELKSGSRAIVPGNITQSELMRRITSTDDAVRMPPEGSPLTEQQIELIRRWISEGASWNDHWAFLPVSMSEPPDVKRKEWVKNPIDQFILNRLDQAQLQPVAPAEKAALLRRVTFDLIGLPPNPSEVESFLNDSSPNAYEKVVDRLLDSAHFGEKWARHWLD